MPKKVKKVEGEPVEKVEVNNVEKELTAKQELFCQEYLIDLNASAAARRAGYSEDTAYSIGWENLKKPEIQARIEALRKDTQDKFNITKERIYLELSRLAYFDPQSMYDDNGNIKPVSEWTKDQAAAITGLEIETEVDGYSEREDIDNDGNLVKVPKITTTVSKFKYADKRAALETLNKMMGFNAPTKTEHTGSGGKDLIPAIPKLILNIVQPDKEDQQ